MQLPVDDAVGSGNRCSQENLANLAFAPKQRSNALGEWQTPKGVYGHWEKPTTTNEQVLLWIILNTLLVLVISLEQLYQLDINNFN